MIDQIPCRRRALYVWRKENNHKVMVQAIPTKDAADLLPKSYVLTTDEIKDIKAKRKKIYSCEKCYKEFPKKYSLTVHLRTCE